MKLENLMTDREIYTMTLSRRFAVLHVDSMRRREYTYWCAETLEGARELMARKRAEHGGTNWYLISPFGEVLEEG